MLISILKTFLFISNSLKENNTILNNLVKSSDQQIINLTELNKQNKASAAITEKQLNETLEKLDTLEKANKELQTKVDFLQKEATHTKEAREKKEKKAKKLRNAKKKPKRDMIEFNEFNFLLNMIDNNNYCDLRRKAALLILYTTGLRVSNLLIFKVKNIKDLITDGKTRIDLIKGGNVQHMIVISNSSSILLLF